MTKVFNSKWFVIFDESDGFGAFWPIDNKAQSVRFDLVCSTDDGPADTAFIPNPNLKFPQEVEAILGGFGIKCQQ